MAENNDIYHSSTSQTKPDAGPFLAKVISHLDSSYMGDLQVEVLRPVGAVSQKTQDGSTEGQLTTVHYMSPFYGVTGVQFTGQDPNDYNNTQKSYGMWMIPPDVGTTVVVFFIQGDTKRGYWMGCVQDEHANFMLPGIAATEYAVDGGDFQDLAGRTGRVPVAEYNKNINNTGAPASSITKPKHPLTAVLQSQGLLLDDIRGITTSSARREVPSMVFGISTPGPVDKNTNAPRGAIGKAESRVPNAFVSRLGGTTFVMDDGDSTYLRKTPASSGPPDYAAVEQDETGGNVNIPHNELVRIRTRTGHQILLHNSEDLIYIANARGTAWVELTSNGKIDIFCADSISVHTGNDINFTADRDINFTAKGNINLNAAGNANVTATGNTNINSAHHYETAGKIDMNGPVAAKATKAARIPTAEPWAGHENLNPSQFTPANTKSVAAPTVTQPTYYKKYTTSIDTFKNIPPPNQGQ
jgi:phage gp45-like